MTIKSQLKTEIKNKFNINIDDYCPKNDEDAWLLYPNYNFIYNKIFICQIQNLSYAPMPILPNKYPVVIKPIINLMGMGDIDQLPKDFLRLILLNYIKKISDIKEEFKKLILDVDIYLFPVWQTIKEYHDLNNIYNYLKISWEQKLIDMDDIIMYYFDNIEHAHPNKYKRWFLFSINNYDDGLKLKNKIENDINIKFL